MRQKMSPRWFTSARWLIAAGWISVFAAGQARADYRTAVLADKPIGYWSLDEGKGVAPNLGTLGKNGNGEYFGEEFVAIPGPNLPGMPAGGKAIQLTRPNDGAATPPEETSGVRVDTPILDGLTAFTLEGWINPTAAQNSNRSGLFGQDNAIEFGFIGANNVHFWAELPGGGDVHTNSDWTKGNGSWHHIALSGNGVTGDMDFYVDGVAQDFTQNNSQPLEDIGKDSYGVSGNPFMIGGIVFGADRQFEGGFDEVAAFDKYLTAAQIKAHYDAALKGGNPYDYNEDGSLTVVDLDLLRGAIQTGSTNTKYDVDTNGKIELNDLSQYVERKTILNTYIGDANLDKQFSSGDLVTVFAAGKYEVGGAANVTWAQGDWNADGFFNTGDLVFAFQGGGYEKGPRAAVSAVPEPGSALLLLTGTICLAVRRRRH